MKREVQQFLEQIVIEEYSPVPSYGFTVNDIVASLEEKGLEVPARSTILRRLMKRVKNGELLQFTHAGRSSYFVPKHLAKNAEIDQNAVLDVEK